MLRGLICQGVHCFMCLCSQGVHKIMCVYHVKWVNVSRSPLFHVLMCVLSGLICRGVHYFICLYVCVYDVERVNMLRVHISCVYVLIW